MGFSDYENIYLVITNTYINAVILGRTVPISARQQKKLKWT